MSEPSYYLHVGRPACMHDYSSTEGQNFVGATCLMRLNCALSVVVTSERLVSLAMGIFKVSVCNTKENPEKTQ
jgi:hypothetical protein